jgi:membrane fusion protein (multidrug efflux system)
MNYRHAALLAATLAVTAGCGKDALAPAPAPEVSVITIRRVSVPVTTELPGRTSATLVSEVRARVDGIVQQRLFEEGADVSANQALFQIDPAPYRAALDSAKAQLARARANVESTTVQAERDEVLAKANAVSRQAYLDAVATQRQASADVAAGLAAVELATINLGYTQVSAPITGRIGPALVTQGAYVQASVATLMATIQQIDPIYVDLNPIRSTCSCQACSSVRASTRDRTIARSSSRRTVSRTIAPATPPCSPSAATTRSRFRQWSRRARSEMPGSWRAGWTKATA